MTTVYEVRGTFDQSAALRLRDSLLGAARNVTIDFSGASNLDGSLALLAVNLIVLHRNGRHLYIRGLEESARTFLLHFGIAVGPDGFAEFLLRDEVPFSD